MKLLGLDIRRTSPAPTPAARGNAPSGAQAGVVGSDQQQFYTWLWSDDPNPVFRTKYRYEIFSEMRVSDPSIRAALRMCKLPARAAKWRVDPFSDDPLDVLVADACAWQLGVGEYEDGPLNQTWGELQAQASLKLDFGCFFEEIVWGPEPFTFADADGDEHLLFGVQRLAPRSPHTVLRIESDPATGKIDLFEQWIPNAKPIPSEKLVAHVVDPENGSWLGTSMLRSMYGSWKFKRELMISAGIGWDRFAAGIPVVRHPDGTENERQAARIGRSLRNHERSYVTMNADQGWDVNLLNGSGSLADPVPLLNFYCQQIATAAVEFFTSLGTSQHGSRAVGDVLVEPFFQDCQAQAEDTASTYRKQLLRKFVTINFGERVPTPHLRPGRIGGRDIAVLTQALYDASQAGVDFTDRETQDAVREILELPNTPEEMAPVIPGEGDAPPVDPNAPPPDPTPVVGPSKLKGRGSITVPNKPTPPVPTLPGP